MGAGAVIEAGLVNQSHIELLFETVWYTWIPTLWYTKLPSESYIGITARWMIQLTTSCGNISLHTNSMSGTPLINHDEKTDDMKVIHSLRCVRGSSPFLACSYHPTHYRRPC